ncbi:MAG: hypothetical protein ACR2J8_15080 [Thermomicrobiales bacterium]
MTDAFHRYLEQTIQSLATKTYTNPEERTTMGQYFLIINETKREYLHPHKLGSGLKFYEMLYGPIGNALLMLTRRSNEGGGGDISDATAYYEESRDAIIGRWAGDKISVIGDYDASDLYAIAQRQYTDISDRVRIVWNKLLVDDQYGYDAAFLNRYGMTEGFGISNRALSDFGINPYGDDYRHLYDKLEQYYILKEAGHPDAERLEQVIKTSIVLA